MREKMKFIKNITKKLFTQEVILYAIFGLLTTVINLGSFYIMNTILHWNENISNIIAIILAVLVAYVTNKDLVFHSEAKELKEKIREFFKFILGRAFTMVIEMLGFYLLYTICAMPMLVAKCIITVIVIVLNFFISKFFTFKQK